MEGVGRLSGGCVEAPWRMWGDCLESIVRLSRGFGRGCKQGVGRLSGGCVGSIWGNDVGRLSRGCEGCLDDM